jgi:beta-phosphoglucomutase family hydrolase
MTDVQPGPARVPLRRFDAFVLDLDGVVTDTAAVHARAWKRLIDDHLRTLAGRGGPPFRPFTDEDYRRFVDGRARIDGVTAFLASRGIELPLGDPRDPPSRETAWGLANRKNELFLAAVADEGVRVFASSVELLRRLRARGIRTAVVTASRNAVQVLEAAGAGGLFDARVDGTDAEGLGLPGKPDPASFLEAAHRLGVDPARAAVIEDALAGVEAGRRGGFGLVVGVDRVGQGQALEEHGADIVVTDLADLVLDDGGPLRPGDPACALCLARADGDEWLLHYEGFDPAQEGTREALLTLGNGYLATRGAAPEAVADGVHYPGTYAAGVYNRLCSEVGGRVREDESVVNLPNWLSLTFRPVGGRWLEPGSAQFLHHHASLDLRRGLLTRELEIIDGDGRRTRLRQRRLVSMAAPHLAALETTITPENWSGPLEVRSALDARVTNSNVASFRGLAGCHLEQLASGADGETVWVVAETSQSKVRVAEAARTRLPGGEAAGAERRLVSEPGLVAHEFSLDARQGVAVTVEKVAALFTSRDRAISEPLLAARQEVGRAGGFEELLEHHTLAWEQLWRGFRLAFGNGDQEGQRVANLHLFHVLQTLSPHTEDLDVGVPARGLHGEGYLGHVFWDELFVFPLLNLRLPQLSRALLLYRYRRLPAARHLAAKAGLCGARFPWQSGSDGREETPTRFLNPRSGRWMADNSRCQVHVNLAVAFNVWHYYQTTGDLAFLAGHGAELLVEIARFFASLATYDPGADRYHLRGVMGPDEFHDGYPDRPGEGIDDNAYVNVMTAWMLCRAGDAHSLLGPDCGGLWARLGVTGTELEAWDHLSRRLSVPFRADGLIDQFEGYSRLAELGWDAYRARYGDLGRLDLILEAEGDTTNRYQVSKQADVLMLFYLLSAEELTALLARLDYPFDPATIPVHVEYYLARTTHGSTLSRVAHAWVVARTDRRRSWSLLREALQSDVSDIQGGTTREGIHLGAMAGTVDILSRCYTGMEARGDVLRLNPLLPDELEALEFDVSYRGQWITIHIDHDEISFRSLPCAAQPMTIGVGDEAYELAPGGRLVVAWPRARDSREAAEVSR